MREEPAIRPIRPEDNAALADLVRASLQSYGLDIPGTAYFDPSLEALSRAYGQAGREYLVLTTGGRPVGGGGFAGIDLFPDCCELQKLYLAEEFRGLGLGHRLLREIEARAFASGYRQIYLETHSLLREALALYARCGYRRIPRPEAVVHSAMDCFMLKKLSRENP